MRKPYKPYDPDIWLVLKFECENYYEYGNN